MDWKTAVEKLRESFSRSEPREVGEPERRAEDVLCEMETMWSPDQLESARAKLIRQARGEYQEGE